MALIAFGPKDTENAGRAEAIQACRDDVRSQLKAPRTAKFSGETATKLDGGWRVTGVVDAESSFGALVRTSRSCVGVTGGSASATLDEQ